MMFKRKSCSQASTKRAEIPSRQHGVMETTLS